MEEKRVTAMQFEDEDDFSENAENPASVQNQQKPDMAQTPPAANKSNTQLTSDPAKNHVQPSNQQIPKSAPASTTGNDQKLSTKNTASTSQKDKTKDQDQKKPRKPRKTKEEQLKYLHEQEKKALIKLANIKAKMQNISLTSEEKKEAKRKVETRCKIIAGAVAFELAQKGQAFFTLNNFKNRIDTELTKPLEIAFLNRKFKEKDNK